MDPLTTLFALVVVLLTVAIVVQPLIIGSSSEDGTGVGRQAAALRERADLLAERNRLYAAIRDLDFDYTTNKISDEDYVYQRYTLVAQGVDVLQQLDLLPAADGSTDAIEVAVAALGTNGTSQSATQPAQRRVPAGVPAARFCPQCGGAVARSDKFCGSCGERL